MSDVCKEILKVFEGQEIMSFEDTRISKLGIENSKAELLYGIQIPYSVGPLRFSLDLEHISKDASLCKFAQTFKSCFTIGYKPLNVLFGLISGPSDIGLEKSSSLSEMRSVLESSDDFENEEVWSEIKFAYRLCVNFDNAGEVILIDPDDFNVIFVNSDIEVLAKTLLAYETCLGSEATLEERATAFETELSYIDPKSAMDDSKCFWASLVAGYKRDSFFLDNA